MKTLCWCQIRASLGQGVEPKTSTLPIWLDLGRSWGPHRSVFKMELFFNPFDSLVCILLGISFTVWFTLLLVFIIVPAILGVSFGIRRLYMKSLLKVFEVSTVTKMYTWNKDFLESLNQANHTFKCHTKNRRDEIQTKANHHFKMPGRHVMESKQEDVCKGMSHRGILFVSLELLLTCEFYDYRQCNK